MSTTDTPEETDTQKGADHKVPQCRSQTDQEFVTDTNEFSTQSPPNGKMEFMSNGLDLCDDKSTAKNYVKEGNVKRTVHVECNQTVKNEHCDEQGEKAGDQRNASHRLYGWGSFRPTYLQFLNR